MQRILRSPVNLKKKVPVNKVFGQPLAQQMQDSNGEICIPFIVRKIVAFVIKHGIGHEGIFRMSGSSRVVDKLRTSFDKFGDADLEEASDVMAVASLLKLYLRELPEAVISAKFHRRFLAIYEENESSNSVNQLDRIREILDELPKENYNLLKYLTRFLAQVASHESTNKMTPFALAIVFGPNLFRCDVGFQSFKEQSVINNIVRTFIQDFGQLFEGEELQEDPLESPGFSPTIIQVKENQTLSPPQVKPRKKKKKPQTKPLIEVKDLNSNSIIDGNFEDRYKDISDFNGALLSPRDICTVERAHSPFHLDSDTGTSNTATPVTNVSCSELVEKAIGETISYHLFGDSQDNESTTETFPHRPIRRKDRLQLDFEKAKSKRTMEDSKTMHPIESPLREKPLLDSPVFKQFEKTGLVIQPRTNSSLPSSLMIPDDLFTSELSPRAKRRQKNAAAMASSTPLTTSTNTRKHFKPSPEYEELELIERKTEVLSSLTAQRVSPPKNRRQPSRKQRSRPDKDATEIIEDVPPVTLERSRAGPSEAFVDWSKETHISEPPHLRFKGDENHNGVAPNQMLKIDIPPLDLDSLHEHIDGNEPVQSWKTKVTLKTEGEALLSPRSSKMQRTSSVPEDTDVPPSPPNSQPYIKGSFRSDSAESLEVKQMLKKIRGMKKRIRRFEDQFHEENGFKPSHSDKANNADIKKIMLELKKANKELKKMKASARSEEYTDQQESGSPSEPRSLQNEENKVTSSKADALKKAQELLDKKRQESNRPYDLQSMNHEQVQEEKVAIQKVLLQLENDYGRPKNKSDKDLMRPLYDRYRNIKKIMARQELRVRNMEETRAASCDLQTIEENEETIEFVAKTSPTANQNDYSDQLFMVTQQVPDISSSSFSSPRDFDDASPSPGPLAIANLEQDMTLHQASLEELLVKQRQAKQDKKHLRKKLKDYEDNFVREKGRKLLKEDWAPLGEDYEQYKHLKKQLKLLDALISKQEDVSF